ncbi:MAG: hypothetical protein SPL05_01835 [Eubacteriales bacterium]|nr:hypothetical protein [Eubacteriales bacterium]
MNKILFNILICFCAICLLSTGFAETNTMSNTELSTKAPAEPSAAPFATPEDNTVLATVNSTEILAKEVNKLFNNLAVEYGLGENAEDSKELYGLALNAIIQKYVILQKGETLQITKISEDEMKSMQEAVNKRFTSAIESMAAQQTPAEASEEDKANILKKIQDEVAAAGIGEEVLLANEIERLKFNKIEEFVTKDLTLTDEFIQEVYQTKVQEDTDKYSQSIYSYELAVANNVPTWYTPAGYKGIKHILLNVDEALLSEYNALKAKFEEQSSQHNDSLESTETNAEETVNVEEIEKLEQKILESIKDTVAEIKTKFENKTSFDELIAEYGNDPGMTQEPFKTEGYHVHENSVIYDKAFTNAANLLNELHTIGEPVIGMYGVHILYYNMDIAEGATALTDTNKAILEKEALTQLRNTTIATTFEAWKNEAKIEYLSEFKPAEN